MTGEKEVFKPNNPERVTMYVCGPTVYNRVHIGNARPVVVFDTLYRVLKTLYKNVEYARNITDVDDKIIKAAAENNEPISDLTQRFTEAFFEDMAELNNLVPSIIPYATEHLPEMIAMVKMLVDKGHAYAITEGEAKGHVLFDVKSMPDYGQLSNRNLDDMLAGARVEVADYKRYAGDFVLWKPAKDDELGWESPWGHGRPGWHLECSAMIQKHLGETIDIHGGGRDLVFPHHENEIAQSQCCHDGKTFVKYWMHNGYINIDGEKMSKSLGNFKLVNDLLQSYRGEALRFAILTAQYRSELTFGAELLDQAQATLDTLYGALQQVEAVSIEGVGVDLSQSSVYHALLDDLNTPVAMRELHGLAKQLNKAADADKAAIKAELLAVADLMGLLQQNPSEWLKGEAKEGDLSDADIEALIEKRVAAKAEKDYATADQVRDQLTAAGITLQESRDGVTWRRA